MSQEGSVERRAHALFNEAETKVAARVDGLFIGAFAAQWLAGVALAQREDLLAAAGIGAAIAVVPVGSALRRPGARTTRVTIAATQILYGALLVHLTHGRFGTTWHVFPSLALLSLYRDARVIAATAALFAVYALAPVEPAQIAWVFAAGGILAFAARASRATRLALAKSEAENEALRAPRSVPAAPVEEPRSSGIRASATPAEPLECRVLVVEDDVDTQQIVTEYLRRAGAIVTVAGDGEGALDAVEAAAEATDPYDLVLMDMSLPVMDGYAATTELRRRGYGGPILALTAKSMPGDRARCINAGCTDYLAKPIARDRLVHAVAQHALGSAATIPPGLVRARAEDLIYSEFADDADMQELLDGFVTRLGETTARIEACLTAKDHVEVQRFAHQLRGAAGSYGFPTISAAAGAVETISLRGEDPTAALAELAALCRRARARSRAKAA